MTSVKDKVRDQPLDQASTALITKTVRFPLLERNKIQNMQNQIVEAVWYNLSFPVKNTIWELNDKR